MVFTASFALFSMMIPFVTDDHEAPGRAAANLPANVLFEEYAPEEGGRFFEKQPRAGLPGRRRGNTFAQ